MTALLAYLLRSAVNLFVFSTFFLIVARRSSHFRFNRAVLLAGSLLCLILPLLPVSLPGQGLVPEVLTDDFAAGIAAAGSTQTETSLILPWKTIAVCVYLAGTLTVLAIDLVSYAKMFRIFRRTPSIGREGCKLHLLDKEVPSFSWMRHIVMSRSDFENYPAILAHELAHVRCGHSRDLLFYSFAILLQWFNPLVWICRNELRLLHEYDADDRVIRQGMDGTEYQMLLIRKAVGEARFVQANAFNHAQLELRLAQLQRSGQSPLRRLIMLAVLPLLAGTTLLMAERTDKIVAVSELQQQIYRNLNYPASCREDQKAGAARPVRKQSGLDH